MKRLYTLIFLTILSLEATFAQQTQRMSVAEAVDFALKNAPAFQNYLLDEQVARRKTSEARTGYYPRLTGTVDARDYIKQQTIVLPAFIRDPSAPADQVFAIPQGTKYNVTAAAELTQPLLDASIGRDVAYARVSEEAAAVTTASNRIYLRVNVAKAYYTALLNEEKLRQAEKTLVRNEKFYQDLQAKYTNQQALKTDVQQAYLNVSNAQLDQHKAEDAYWISLLDLKNQIGMDETVALTLTDSLTNTAVDEAALMEDSAQSVVETRVDYRQQLLNRQLNQITLQKTQRQYLPTISLTGYVGSLGLTNEFSGLTEGENWYGVAYVGARISWDIFDGLQKSALVQQQRLAIVKNENTLRSLRNTIRYETQNTRAALKNALRAVQIQRENVRIAEEVVAARQVRFDQGLGLGQEVIDAEATLQDTQLNYLQAFYDLIAARLNYQKAHGKLE